MSSPVAQFGKASVLRLLKTSAPTSSTSSSSTSSSSSSSSSNSSTSESKKESASDALKYNRDNPIYKNYSKAKRYLKSTASGLESSVMIIKDIEGDLEEVQEDLTFLEENDEGQKQYYQEFKTAHAEHSAVVAKKKEKSATLSPYMISLMVFIVMMKKRPV